jgi:uncharacterized protein Smg (DUF494 family)
MIIELVWATSSDEVDVDTLKPLVLAFLPMRSSTYRLLL